MTKEVRGRPLLLIRLSRTTTGLVRLSISLAFSGLLAAIRGSLKLGPISLKMLQRVIGLLR